MRKKLYRLLNILLVSTLLILNINIDIVHAAEWPSGPSVASGSAIVMDASTGTVLYGYKMNDKKYPASITKIMTTLVALENSSLTDTITLSKGAVTNLDSGSTTIARVAGEKFSMGDGLYAVMLASANEVANGVAETVAGSNEEFAKLMNEKAKALGCKGTHFVNPHGLSDKNHYTTAYDMALISSAALKLDDFRKITGSPKYTFPTTNKSSETYTFANHQKMLTGATASLKYDGCIGGKTGYTSASGNTLVTFAERNGLTLVSIVMDSNYNDQYSDSKALLDFGFNKFKSFSITDEEGSAIKNDLNKYQQFFEIGKDDSAYIYIDEDSSIVLPNNAKYSDAKKTVKYNEGMEIKNGENVIGTITYTYKDTTVGIHNIMMNYYTSSSIPTIVLPDEETDYSILLNRSSDQTVGKFNTIVIDTVLVALCIIVVLAIYLFIKQTLKKRKRRHAYNSRRRHSRKFWDDFDL